MKQFATEAKRYGVVYCALRGKEKSADGMVEITVRAEDAFSRIDRIVVTLQAGCGRYRFYQTGY